MITKDVPLFNHDCSQCTFLGNYEGQDLHFCPQGGRIPTVIARFGNDGPDYASGLHSSLPELREAAKRARQAGLLKD